MIDWVEIRVGNSYLKTMFSTNFPCNNMVDEIPIKYHALIYIKLEGSMRVMNCAMILTTKWWIVVTWMYWQISSYDVIILRTPILYYWMYTQSTFHSLRCMQTSANLIFFLLHEIHIVYHVNRKNSNLKKFL